LVAFLQDEVPAAEWGDDAVAKDATRRPGDWQFEFTPFLWATYFRYDGSLGPFGATGDIDFTELTSPPNLGFSGRIEARRRRFGAFLEAGYILASAEYRAHFSPISALEVKVDVDMEMVRVTLGGLYRLGDPGLTLDLMAGVRYTYIETDTSVDYLFDSSFTKEFFDPMIAARLRWDFAQEWRLAVRTNAVGLGVDTEYTWGLQGTIGYRVSEHAILEFGYRYQNLSQEVGLLNLDLEIHGPIMGITFSF